jgi:23S rRNA (uracil1939-C5)-methyltransferase
MNRRPRQPRAQPRDIDFEIDHIDPLGQGVSKQNGKITFVAGTLPGERGAATVYKRAKGVQFAVVQNFQKTADNRVESECPHFDRCPGCQFLHTDYKSELGYKKATLERHLGALGVVGENIEVVQAPRRLAYRNRVQLHYRHKYIGMLDTVSNEILEVPHCKIMRPELQAAFDQLYRKEWMSEYAGHGHCELYFKSGEVSLEWDESYAHGGFSQVYEEMNQVLQDRVQAQLEELEVKRLLDIFAGNGNLSDAFASGGGDRVMIDNYSDYTVADKPENFYQMDLYEDQALPNFIRRAGTTDFDALLIDPPRRGFPGLDKWVKRIKPRYLLYVSCNPASLARDLRGLSTKFRLKTVQLLDMFPATAHFETFVVLQMRQG